MIYVWAVLASAIAVGIEILYRKGVGWHEYPYVFIPPAIGINYCIYRLLSTHDTLLGGIVLFSLGALVMRLLASQFILNEPIEGLNAINAAALLFAAVAGSVWNYMRGA